MRCKDVYIDDRPATGDRRPTANDRPTPHIEKFEWPYLRNGLSDALQV